MNEYKEYKEYIRGLAQQNRNVVFFNSSADHGAFVMSTIFDNAKTAVKIYCGNFSGDISKNDHYRLSLKNYLHRGGKLQILLQEEKLKLNPNPHIFDILKLYSITNDNISIRQHPYKIGMPKEGKSDVNEVHFTVADDKMYRIEEDIDKFTAIGNFNDVEKSKELSKFFDTIFADPQTTEVVL